MVALWACYCCRKRHGNREFRRVPIIRHQKPCEKMTKKERLDLIEKQLFTMEIGGSVQSFPNMLTSAQVTYGANCCNNCAEPEKHTNCIQDTGADAVGDTGANADADADNSSESERSIVSRTWKAAATSINQYRQKECIICFEEYKEGDVVCVAKTDQCEHVFHKHCAVEWLMTHDECPLCRVDIINAKTVEYEEADGDEELDATDIELGAPSASVDINNSELEEDSIPPVMVDDTPESLLELDLISSSANDNRGSIRTEPDMEAGDDGGGELVVAPSPDPSHPEYEDDAVKEAHLSSETIETPKSPSEESSSSNKVDSEPGV